MSLPLARNFSCCSNYCAHEILAQTMAKGLAQFGKRYGYLIGPVLVVVVLFVVARSLRDVQFEDVFAEMRKLPAANVVLAALFCVVNYLILSCYDVLAIQYLGKKLAYPKVLLTSIISFAVSQNLGAALLSGGAVRFRFYPQWGFSTKQVGTIILYTGAHFWLAFFLLSGLLLLLSPESLQVSFNLSERMTYGIGILMVLPLVAYLVMLLVPSKKQRDVSRHQIAVYGLRSLIVGCFDWITAAAVLYFLLPVETSPEFLETFASYLLSQVTGVISHVPGGVGVFEGVMSVTLGDTMTTEQIVSSLILFRFLFYFVPLFVAAVLFVGFEIVTRLGKARA